MPLCEWWQMSPAGTLRKSSLLEGVRLIRSQSRLLYGWGFRMRMIPYLGVRLYLYCWLTLSLLNAYLFISLSLSVPLRPTLSFFYTSVYIYRQFLFLWETAHYPWQPILLSTKTLNITRSAYFYKNAKRA